MDDARSLSLLTLLVLCAAAREPPRVTQRVNGRVLSRPGFTLKLPCPVEADPPPLIMWTKDGRNIHGGWTRYRVLRDGLRIAALEQDDAGSFVCRATNGFGSVAVNYSLDVLEEGISGSSRSMGDMNSMKNIPGAKPRFTQPAKMRQRVIARPVGSSVRLKCAASGRPRPDITWFKDDKLLPPPSLPPPPGRTTSKKPWTLGLRNLQPEDSGSYMCRVSNRLGEISATYHLDVIELMRSKPVLTGTHPINTTVEYGGSTSLQCKVRSDVKPVIQWLKRNNPGFELKENSTIEVDGEYFTVLRTGDVWSRPDGSYLNKLVITRASATDAGMYICLGANTMGYSFRSAFLTVLPNLMNRGRQEPVLLPAPSTIPWSAIVAVPTAVVMLLALIASWLCCRGHCNNLAPHTAVPESSAYAQCGPHVADKHAEHTASAQPMLPEKDEGNTGAGLEDAGCVGPPVTATQVPSAVGTVVATTAAMPQSVSPTSHAYHKLYHMSMHNHYHSHGSGKMHDHQYVHYKF
uniref:fibroblast growth factor receptor-like 1 isoform X1 n=1 Tax=Myxine glutinosa TaxID=7769 RepID=UPI00358F4C28